MEDSETQPVFPIDHPIGAENDCRASLRSDGIIHRVKAFLMLGPGLHFAEWPSDMFVMFVLLDQEDSFRSLNVRLGYGSCSTALTTR